MDLPRKVFRKRTRSNRLVDAVPPSCRPLWRFLLSCARCITPLVTVLHLNPTKPMPSLPAAFPQRSSARQPQYHWEATVGRRDNQAGEGQPPGLYQPPSSPPDMGDNLSGISNGRSSRGKKIQGLDPEFFCGNLRCKEKKLYLIATICRESSPRVDTTGCSTSTTHV